MTSAAAAYAGLSVSSVWLPVRTVRTMLSPENRLVLSFFRSQGMMAGRFIPLEMSLEP